jgi:transmembrane sensor
MFTDQDRLIKELNRFRSVDSARSYAKLEMLMKTEQRSRVIRWVGLCAAAVAVSAFAGILLIKRLHGNTDATTTQAGLSIPPGKDTALLTKDAATGYNVLTIPRSGEYHLTLPDGSRVWLNDSSSIVYPAAFVGHDRTVELSGEAYFEIVPDATRPFIVRLKDATVEARGTIFDVSSYPGEDGSRTVLVKGTVLVSTAKDSALLQPNEQALVKTDDSLGVTKNVPASAIIAWKDGFFFFNQTPLDEVMRQLARWYDIEVVNKTVRPDLPFDGRVDRRVPLDSLLKNLGKSQKQIQFRLENRTLIVLPK